MNTRLTTQQDLTADAQALVRMLATTWGAVRVTAAAGGLEGLGSEWHRHVRETEEHLFPRLIADGPAADAPVGFCMAEHAALNARLATLGPAQPTSAWLREAERVIGGLVQHLFLEARILQPLVDRLPGPPAEMCCEALPRGREEA
jgi:Hemerythrin HHE cation binding domain